MRTWPLALLLLACGPPDDPAAPSVVAPDVAFAPPPVTAWRLTAPQLRNTWHALTGVRWDGALPADLSLHGYTHLGASELTIPPVELEEYEAAAWQVTEQWMATPDAVAAMVGCPDLFDAEPPRAESCARGWTVSLLHEAFRRDILQDDLDEFMYLYTEVEALAGRLVAFQAVGAAVLQSPDVLFRVEHGAPDPDNPGWRRLRDRELANRLSYTLTDGPPDAELLSAAESGLLRTPGQALDHALRLIESEAGRQTLLRWWYDTLELQHLEHAEKDPDTVGLLTETLRQAMIDEVMWLFDHLVITSKQPMSEVLTTDQALLTPELATLYGETFDGVGTLSPVFDRGGLLGRAAILAANAHPSSTSPTHRGRFVRERLLCQSIPPPPPGVVASLSEANTEGSLRDRLEQHASDPACSGCHQAMDPIGFALEAYDAIGYQRISDNGFSLDTTGELDGATFDGAAELGLAVAEHPELYGCMALQFVRYAIGQAETQAQLPAVDRIAADTVHEGGRLDGLLASLVSDDVFLSATAPLGDPCETEGETRACATDCGEGTETCSDGTWRGCDAPAPEPESCDGIDQDCDGVPDPALLLPCVGLHGPGVSTCDDGTWSTCDAPEAALEICNGQDDDGDGDIDEGLDIDLRYLDNTTLTAAHSACHPDVDAWSPACFAARHRACATTDCAVSGFGPSALDLGESGVTCLDDAHAVVVQTSFTELRTHHDGCNAAELHGGPCNAAISRLCGARGYGTGFGPVEHTGDNAWVTCTPSATVLSSSYTALSTHDAACNGSTERWGAHCSRAIAEWCAAAGYQSGHGPLENLGDNAMVACLGEP